MFKPYLNKYPKDVPSKIGNLPYDSLSGLIENTFKKYADNCAFQNMDVQITYAQLEKKSGIIATYLQQSLQLKLGDRVAIMMPNLIQYPVVLLGVIRAGMVVVNINPLYTSPELKHQLLDSGAKAIFIVSNFAITLEAVISQTRIKHVVLTRIGDEFTVIKRDIVNFVIKYVKRMVPKYKLPNAVSYRKALKIGRKGQFIRPQIGLNDIVFIQYTGGTTGVSKGACLTNKNMLSSLMQGISAFSSQIISGKEKIVTALPLYHIFALTLNFLLFFVKGAKNILITNPKDMGVFLDTLRKNEFTYFSGLNTLFVGMMGHHKFSKIDFTSLKFTIAGGMATSRSVADDWFDKTGCIILEGYGLTECCPIVSMNSYDTLCFTGSIGLPLPSTDIRLKDDDGVIVCDVEMLGEIEIFGPQVMLNYWNNEEETKNIMTEDGWLKTGDIGKFDAAGLLYIVDRKKDMILISGFNVYPIEVEEALSKLKGILECAVIGIHNDVTGGAVKAFIVLDDHTLTMDKIMVHCKKYLTLYKCPHSIEFVTELPKNNVGKVLKRLLRDR
ncbi:MAG: AMP-binding protein [Psychromonas sp.]|nr:AMP-binding protein [Psychromonas sp.]